MRGFCPSNRPDIAQSQFLNTGVVGSIPGRDKVTFLNCEIGFYHFIVVGEADHTYVLANSLVWFVSCRVVGQLKT